MDIMEIVNFLNAHVPPIVLLVLGFFGLIVTVGTAVIAITPTKNDDAWLSKIYDVKFLGFILKLVVAFSPLDKKKDGSIVLSNP